MNRQQQLLAIQSKFAIAIFIGDMAMYQQAVDAFLSWRSK
ncbi:MAG: host cell division inhibitory peptide Kil [Pseudomonadota bacterium]